MREKKRVGHLVRECGVGGVNSVTETLNGRMDHLVFVMQKPVPLLPKESVLWNSHIGGHFDKNLDKFENGYFLWFSNFTSRELFSAVLLNRGDGFKGIH